jgi:HAD superfamily hydrolase (TIGR01484 family)
MKTPRSINELDVKKIVGIFFDIDDTFSSHGKIRPEAYQAIWALKKAGKIVVPVTGRPAGWCDLIGRMWPVNAVIGENGALYFMMKDNKLVKKYVADEKQRESYKQRLVNIRDEILKSVPGTALASDQDYREFDLAIDFCEDVPRISEAGVNKIVEIGQRHGAVTKVSSIHVNLWFGEHTKLTTTKLYVKNELGMDLNKENERFIFVGDSGNDEPMFEYFKNSVGVANVMNFKDRLKTGPAYITRSESGDGFAELATLLLT